MVFYPDNVPRAGRLQQLVDSMDNMQTDIKNYAKEMDEKNKAMRPQVDQLLKDKGIDNIDVFIEKSTAKMTPEEKKQYEALIAASKASKSGFNYAYFMGTILMVPEGVVLTVKMIMSLARLTVRIGALIGIANIFRVAEGGAAAAGAVGEAARELEKAAMEAETAAKEAGVAGEAGVEVSEAAKMMARVSKFVKVLGVIGFVVTVVVAIIEAVEGEAQKEELIKAIQGAQPARLSIAYFKQEATIIMEQLQMFSAYLDASVGEDKNPGGAAYLSQKIIKNISADNTKIDWYKLEESLENQDKSAGNYYKDADLTKEEVVRKAISTEH